MNQPERKPRDHRLVLGRGSLLVGWRNSVSQPCLSSLSWGSPGKWGCGFGVLSSGLGICVSLLMLQSQLLSVYTDTLGSSGIDVKVWGLVTGCRGSGRSHHELPQQLGETERRTDEHSAPGSFSISPTHPNIQTNISSVCGALPRPEARS